ncbi:MAG: carbohydrate ABC transporter permease [Treponema sp.]|nr:carbohydrate ABC transporter permease [Spirochaetia bacterium]MDD6295639.1 carbohydrate ABC transporter permease [Treponema sp.]MDD7449822.1 carbohydrate ABC transporter permease [Treponema sp.]MDY2924914.1 carbohydrate ABC transporter permease [Treponema sp.]
MNTKKIALKNSLTFCLLVALTVIFIFPIVLVFLNSFKSRLYVSTVPFAWPKGNMYVGFENYINGITSSGFGLAFIRSVFISIASVCLIIVCTSMTAWYIVRVKTKISKSLYYIFVFSMIVPFQMVMYTMTYVVTAINFANVFGIVLVYLGFGAGLSVFMFTGFIKSIPLEVEEAATIDGCNPIQTYFKVVFPMLKSTAITVSILQAMWVWNDYLLPYLILGSDHKTVPVAIQLAMQGAYGSTDYGGFMAMLVVSIIPIIAFYISSQKYIIKGVVAGAVKG